MKKELGLLNVICIVVAVLFLGLAVVNALTSAELLTTDNLFITIVCLVMALMFGVNPLLYLKSEGRLPIPFAKRLSQSKTQVAGSPGAPRIAAPAPPLLDAKGRPVPADVRQLASRFGPPQTKDV